jgi:plasmid stabilization system protein ParE
VSRAFAILPDAQREITEAADWYHARNPELGLAFRRELRAKLALVRAHPLRFAPVYKNARAAFLSRHPYRITFTADADEILVIACTHHSRDPQVWMERVR